MKTTYGYARVSTVGQTLEAQLKELKATSCQRIFREKVSGVRADRRELNKMLRKLERDKSEFFHEKTYWKKGFIGNSWEYLRDKGMGGRHLDARTHFYYFATVLMTCRPRKAVS